MIKVYECGSDFIYENEAFLNQNKYMSSLFFVDAKVLNNSDKNNYAIKCEIDKFILLGIKVEPYNLLLYGDFECLKELLTYLKSNQYNYSGIMCSTKIGEHLLKEAEDIVNQTYYLSIGMDFMEAKEYTSKSSEIIEIPTLDDALSIYHLMFDFFKDCGLPDVPNIERIKEKINNYRIIRENNQIISMASFSFDTPNSYRIACVYTVPEYRGKGYARKVVNTLKNEILDMGKSVTLNVDQKNPISNHLYESLGFKKVYSQGIYLIKE